MTKQRDVACPHSLWCHLHPSQVWVCALCGKSEIREGRPRPKTRKKRTPPRTKPRKGTPK